LKSKGDTHLNIITYHPQVSPSKLALQERVLGVKSK